MSDAPRPSASLGTVDMPSDDDRPRGEDDGEDPPPPPGTRLGSYRLDRLVGEGGMGWVFAAEHVKLGRRVAIKMLRARFAADRLAVRRFFDEARAVNRIRHPGLIEITDFVEGDGANYYVMELLEGRSVADLLEDGPLPVERIVEIGVPACEALSAVHQAGIVHRDLKPHNLFVVEGSGPVARVKVLDFGVAKLNGLEGPLAEAKTAAGAIVGTPEYMAPEQAAGRKVDARSDVYAFGVMLYEMATGRRPFIAESFGEYLLSHMTVEPVPPSEVAPQPLPRALEDLILRCLAKRPEDRPQTLREVGDALRQLLFGYLAEDTSPEDTSPTRRAPAAPAERPRRLRVAAVAFALTLAGTAVGASAWMAARGDEESERASTSAPEGAAPEGAPLDEAAIVAPAEPQAPAQVEIHFASEPAGASVIDDETGELLGSTPFSLRFERAGEARNIRFEAEGRRAERRALTLDADARVEVRLEEEPKPAPPPASPRPRRVRKTPPAKVTKPTAAEPKTRKPIDRRGVIDPFASP